MTRKSNAAIERRARMKRTFNRRTNEEEDDPVIRGCDHSPEKRSMRGSVPIIKTKFDGIRITYKNKKVYYYDYFIMQTKNSQIYFIYPSTMEDFNKILQVLKTNNIRYMSIKDAVVRFIIKGIPVEYSIEDVSEELEESSGLEVFCLSRMIKDARTLPTLLLLVKDRYKSKIESLKFLLNRKIRVEYYRFRNVDLKDEKKSNYYRYDATAYCCLCDHNEDVETTEIECDKCNLQHGGVKKDVELPDDDVHEKILKIIEKQKNDNAEEAQNKYCFKNNKKKGKKNRRR